MPHSLSLSKSNFMAGLKCPRLLWCIFNAPEKIPEFDEATRARFDQGHQVGELAKKLYPGGLEVVRDKASVEQTKELVKKKVPLFEASFSKSQAYCKVDILVPRGNQWDIIEVKSAGRVKDEYVWDVAFQRYCVGNVRRCVLMHVNGEYVKNGDLELSKFFKAEDITEKVETLLPKIEGKIKELLKVIQLRNIPKPKFGTECLEPENCPVCSSDLPELAELYLFRKKSYEFINKGITTIEELPAEVKLNGKQMVQREAVLTDTIQVNKKPLVVFLKKLKYPLFFLDFETIGPAIPLFDNTRPFQAIPFQFSVHVLEKDGKLTHHEFLADGPQDPRKEVVNALKCMGNTGTVLAYYMSFEKRVLQGLLELFPEEKWLNSIISRLDDLYIPFQNFWYYHPEQHGSASIKAVLPALTGKSYEGLEISEGDTAANTFMALNYLGAKLDKDKTRENLLEYCKQDTQAMVDILKVLEESC